MSIDGPPIELGRECLDRTRSYPLDQIISYFVKKPGQNRHGQETGEMYEIDGSDDLRAFSRLKDLPFEVQLISLTDNRGGKPDTRNFAMTNWSEHFVDMAPFFADRYYWVNTDIRIHIIFPL